MIYTGVTADSRKVKPGYVFVALSGKNVNGEQFIPQAVQNGAKLIVAKRSVEIPYAVEFKVVEDARIEYARLCAEIYSGFPPRVVGVTGTNGKTSVADYYRQLASLIGNKAASIGTLGVVSKDYHPNFEFEILTSPFPEDLHRLFADMLLSGVQDVALEVSSHGLDQSRMDYVKFVAVGFTNLTRDHLDYHGTMENYLAAKQKLFNHFSYNAAVINIDDPHANDFIAAAGSNKIISYGRNSAADLQIINFEDGVARVKIFSELREFKLALAGDFQIYNALCAFGLALAAGYNANELLAVISRLKAAPGRLEMVANYNDAAIYVDYAHSPDALKNVLSSLRSVTCGRLLVVFGCGGDRDPGKRPIMGEIANNSADIAIVTDDNPRTEDAAVIRKEVIGNCDSLLDFGDRKNAIERAIDMLQPGDSLLIAGKGHEDYQIIGKEKVFFSDKEVAINYVKQLTIN